MFQIPTTITCQRCKMEAALTAWQPPRGYDQHLREYKCPGCGRVLYVTFKAYRVKGALFVS
ncbi:hypothetical protein ES703_66531 [subsurface metagenome]